MNLKLGMQHWRLRLYLPIVYLNNDPFGQLYKKGQCLLDYSMEKDNGKKGLLLAHLSSAQDELLWSLFVRRPSVRASVRPCVRPLTFSNNFSSEAAEPILLKFHMEPP